MKCLIFVLIMLCLFTTAALAVQEDFSNYPPVYDGDELEIPLSVLGTDIPETHSYKFDLGISSMRSDGVRENGADVQPALSVSSSTYHIGAQYGAGKGWGLRFSIPYRVTSVGGGIGGQPTSASVNGFGSVGLFVRKRLWSRNNDESIVGSIGTELPTGVDDGTFDQSNSSTNAYYASSPRRLPLAWQPSNGAVNGYLALAYGKSMRKLCYETLVAYKLHGAGDEDVKLGDVFVVSANATLSLSKRVAASLGVTLKTQKNDSYPNAPAPGIGQDALAGTTTHGTTLFLDPSLRFALHNNATIGISFRYPLVKPDSGLVPESRFSFFFIPHF